MRLLHAGEIYAGRDPLPLFEALAQLNAEPAHLFQLEIMGRCEALGQALRQHGWDEFVGLQGQRAYLETLEAMDAADILVLFDSPGRKIGVPAKLYEYFGAGRPILALAEPDGDVAAILRSSGILHRLASPTNAMQIKQALRELAYAMRSTAAVADPAPLQRFTREAIASALADRLSAVIGQPTPTIRRPDALLQEVEV